MLHRKVLAILVLVGAALALSACATGPHVDLADERLEPAPKGTFDWVYLHPERELPKLETVYIEAPEVHLNEHWLRRYRSDYSSRDLERIESDYGRFLREALGRTLTRNERVTLVDDPAEAQVIFRPRLQKVNIYAPDLSHEGIVRKYAREAGNATFNLTLIDAASGDALAQFIDHRETPSAARAIERANRATNNRHFIRLMERWSRNLAAYLEDIDNLEADPPEQP